MAVPSAVAILADWGAQVTKVEHIKGGDHLRRFRQVEDMEVGDFNFWWELSNRNKRGIALNPDAEDGRSIIFKLIEKADVFITNWRPESLAKRGLDWDRVRPINPSIVYFSLTGFGEQGPDRAKPGYDITAFWTRTGFMHRLQGLDGAPAMQPLTVGDQATSMMITGAVCAALFSRQKTGQGQKVSLSLYHAGVWTMAYEIQPCLSKGMEAPVRKREKVNHPLWNNYQTK
ncbi:MAG: CoA transferase, partial [Deltaproteobacteria bacterium]|nr:CoA transferase [Deltaproteobacteria bacterium]